LGFAAFSGTGKTTLLKKLISILKEKQLRIGIIKQSHHDFDIDIPGKDSYELRKAGATQTLITSPHRWALIQENQHVIANSLIENIELLDTEQLDIILVEGFKQSAFAKIEVHRTSLQKPLLYPNDTNIIAIATDDQNTQHTIPVLDMNNTEEIVDFIFHHFL
jgi:molybdopterin-guanine dinucleotide biosynthesis protein B